MLVKKMKIKIINNGEKSLKSLANKESSDFTASLKACGILSLLLGFCAWDCCFTILLLQLTFRLART